MSCVCLCNLCKGKSQSSRYKVQQHAKLYGAWDPKRPKTRRDSSASESSDSEKEECYVDAVGVDREDQQEDVDFSNCNDDNDDGSWQDPFCVQVIKRN